MSSRGAAALGDPEPGLLALDLGRSSETPLAVAAPAQTVRGVLRVRVGDDPIRAGARMRFDLERGALDQLVLRREQGPPSILAQLQLGQVR